MRVVSLKIELTKEIDKISILNLNQYVKNVKLM